MAPELTEGGREIAAMQFAGGRSIAGLAEEWECDADEIEEAIRMALLESIPERYGGLKVSRREARGEKTLLTEDGPEQGELKWPS